MSELSAMHPQRRLHPQQKQALGVVGGLVLIAAYTILYQYTPLPGRWNDIATILIICLAAALAAGSAWRLVGFFQPGEPPRQMYQVFATGMLCWAAAEVVWLFYWLALGDVPLISLADALWIAGILFFGLAFLQQYRLIFGACMATSYQRLGLITGGVLSLTLALALLVHRWSAAVETSFWETSISLFYPLAELVLFSFALHLGHLFGRGEWGRLWLGLLVFIFSDGLYSILEITGLYASSVEAGNLLSLFVDVLYLAAYLLFALACYQMSLLLRYGPSMAPPLEPATPPPDIA